MSARSRMTVTQLQTLAASLGVPVLDEDVEALAEGLDAHRERMAVLLDADLSEVDPATTYTAGWER